MLGSKNIFLYKHNHHMKKHVLVLFIIFLSHFTLHAQYVQSGNTITTADLNRRAQQLTQQCVYLHIASVGCDALGVILISAGVAPTTANQFAPPNQGLLTAGSLFLLAGPVLGIIEWIKVAHAHSILSLGNPKLSFNSGHSGIGLAYNF
jgi:hypothetical protein